MADEPINLVLERLPLIRETLGKMQGDITELRDEMIGQRTVLIGLGTYIGAINERVEHVEAHLGIAQ